MDLNRYINLWSFFEDQVIYVREAILVGTEVKYECSISH